MSKNAPEALRAINSSPVAVEIEHQRGTQDGGVKGLLVFGCELDSGLPVFRRVVVPGLDQDLAAARQDDPQVAILVEVLFQLRADVAPVLVFRRAGEEHGVAVRPVGVVRIEFDPVRVLRVLDDVAGSHDENIAAGAAGELVVIGAGIQNVVARTAGQRVVALVALEGVVSEAAVQYVQAGAALQNVDNRSPDQDIVVPAAQETIACGQPAHKDIGPQTAIECVFSVTSENVVASVTAGQDVVPKTANDHMPLGQIGARNAVGQGGVGSSLNDQHAPVSELVSVGYDVEKAEPKDSDPAQRRIESLLLLKTLIDGRPYDEFDVPFAQRTTEVVRIDLFPFEFFVFVDNGIQIDDHRTGAQGACKLDAISR